MPKRIYFFEFCYAVGGGNLFVLRLMEYLIVKENIKVGIIDFSDGIVTRTGKKFFPKDDIHYIPYESMDWDLEDDSCIFMPDDRIGCVKNIKAKNIKIICYHWTTNISWGVLFRKKTVYKLGRMLKENNALAFMNFACWASACHEFKQRFEKKYIPLFFLNEDMLPNEEPDERQAAILKQIQKLHEELRKISHPSDEQNTRHEEINVVWLGRIVGSKTRAIKNFIKNFSAYSTSKKKNFHIIGNGPDEKSIKEYCTQFKDINFIFKGLMTGKERDAYLQEHTDVGFAMGTALLNFAVLSLPVIASQNPTDQSYQDNFCWLFDCYEYSLSSPQEADREKEILKPSFNTLQSFNKMLDDISVFHKHEEYGKKCFNYYKEKHGNIEFTGKDLLQCISSTNLTYEKIKKCLKYLPYNSELGIFARRYYLLWLPIVKSDTHRGKVYYYIFNVQVGELQNDTKEKKLKIFGFPIYKTVTHLDTLDYYIFGVKVGYLKNNKKQKHLKFFGFPIYKKDIYGKYVFPDICSKTIKQQCINSYSINKRIFGDNK